MGSLGWFVDFSGKAAAMLTAHVLLVMLIEYRVRKGGMIYFDVAIWCMMGEGAEMSFFLLSAVDIAMALLSSLAAGGTQSFNSTPSLSSPEITVLFRQEMIEQTTDPESKQLSVCYLLMI